ncbi:auxin-responsive protein SAUR36-like [Telopea speciosissima]|uniref:auxin-responsive protein SAUR36-like n=1 Tax=Telopea speciosissima TaxID=54955 RepID=UPI001CC7305C|nr:auxin-responsive protein SAUR36-like [Telopea speciosissima]
MINNKKLIIAMARRWKKFAVAAGHWRISEGRSTKGSQRCKSQVVADKGHFIVYTADKKRFMIPLAYLTTNIFRELLRMSEEEFGLPGDGPITLPCDSAFMEYIISSVKRCPLPSLIQAQTSQQILIDAF